MTERITMPGYPEAYHPVRQESLPAVPASRRSHEVIEGELAGQPVDVVVSPVSQVDELEAMFSAPDAGGRHRAPETEESTGRHASNEVAAQSDYEGSHRVEAPAPAAETHDRFLVRQFSRLANFASKRAEKWGSRRTTREFAGDQVERGRDAAARVGNAVVGSAKGAGEYMANNLRTGWEADKRAVQRTREFVSEKAQAARAHKNALVAAIKGRAAKVGEGIKNGAEKAGRAAKVGGEVLKLTGFAVVGTGAIAVEAAGKGAKYGAQKTAEGVKYGGQKVAAGATRVGTEVKRTASDVRENAADIRTGVIEHSAQRAKAKHERKAAKAAARRAAAEARNQ